jgi:hypothetical protein
MYNLQCDKKEIFGSHLGRNFGFHGIRLECIYVHNWFYELVNVTNCFPDATNLLTYARIVILRKNMYKTKENMRHRFSKCLQLLVDVTYLLIDTKIVILRMTVFNICPNKMSRFGSPHGGHFGSHFWMLLNIEMVLWVGICHQ